MSDPGGVGSCLKQSLLNAMLNDMLISQKLAQSVTFMKFAGSFNAA